MPRSAHAADRAATPLDDVAISEPAIHFHRLRGRADVAGAVHAELVAVFGPPLAKECGRFEKRLLFLRRGDLRHAAIQFFDALQQLAMMRGEQHLLDPFHADLLQLRQHGRITRIDQKRRIALSENVSIAGAAGDKEARGQFLEGSTGRGEEQRDQQKKAHGR